VKFTNRKLKLVGAKSLVERGDKPLDRQLKAVPCADDLVLRFLVAEHRGVGGVDPENGVSRSQTRLFCQGPGCHLKRINHKTSGYLLIKTDVSKSAPSPRNCFRLGRCTLWHGSATSLIDIVREDFHEIL